MNPGSRIPFEQFMAHALYDPVLGYYARKIESIGGRGDFTTAPMLSESLARAIAAWAVKAMRESTCRDLVEIGPGEGTLAAGVLRHLSWWRRKNTRLHLVENSAPLREKQQRLLGKRAFFHATIREALDACGGRAVIYSNELVDAFPVRRFRKSEIGWQELELEILPEGIFRETLASPAPLPDSSLFSRDFPTGQWVEVHDSYRKWLEEWMPFWKSGRLLTIDYGATIKGMYHRQPQGSIRAYLLQQRLTGEEIYRNIGRQDLTADVNFTDLIEWSLPWCEAAMPVRFSDFLAPFAGKNDGALLDEQGSGNAFLVLDQRRMDESV